MHPALLEYYNEELRHLRAMAGEFARENPAVAGRLGLDQFECADPYVERLLEGFAYLSARVHLKLDAEFPTFTEDLMNTVYPDYLAPLPSVMIASFAPDPDEGGLVSGFKLPRGTTLRSVLAPGEQTACEYRVAHEVELYPLRINAVEYVPNAGALSAMGINAGAAARSALRLKFLTTAGISVGDVELHDLVLHVRGTEGTGSKLYEFLTRQSPRVIVRDPATGQVMTSHQVTVEPVGFEDDEALLPESPASFEGYRLLREYFAMPECFHFVRVRNLRHLTQAIAGEQFELYLVAEFSNESLDHVLGVDNVVLFATPAINLFPMRADRINIEGGEREFHVVVDRVRPTDYEVYQVTTVAGHYAGEAMERPFTPVYQADMAAPLAVRANEPGRYFSVHRAPRVAADDQRRRITRSSYAGSEVYLSIVDGEQPPHGSGLQQLSVSATCTNRDLPLLLTGAANRAFALEAGAPVQGVAILAGPSRPREAKAFGSLAWRLINHLSLNYLSIAETPGQDSAAPLRRLLALYADESEPHVRRMLDGLVAIDTKPVVRRIGHVGPIVAARGLQITVTCEEAAFGPGGVFTFGAILERFFAKYTSINSFTETVLLGSTGQELVRWPPRTGLRRLL